MIISDEVLKVSGLSEKQLLLEIVILLFQQEKISLGKASEIISMNQIKLQKLLAERGICVHYDVAELQGDILHLRAKVW
ncbi:MAG: UPF0175 family protein [Nostocales cyanobacterium ELA583]|jgi:predicted HTH domain antitoxin